MSEDDITILDDVILRRVRSRKKKKFVNITSRLYYYQGNFYWAVSPLPEELGRVRGAIRRWKKENIQRVDTDRAHPDYKTVVQQLDEQFAEVDARG
tara:strand:+ start:2096 stop:2383 length:288 start_codon:yes stop_codon:yes gene_type:complete